MEDQQVSTLRCMCKFCACIGVNVNAALDPLRRMDAEEADSQDAVQGNRCFWLGL